jgi:branched-chain amino acid transport system substrate-binding protein
MAKDAVEGSYFVNHLDFDDPDVQDFKTRYKTKYAKDVELNGYLVHDAFLLLSDSITRAGEVNSEKIAAAIETGNVKGITGKIMIGKDTHNPEGKDAAIIKIVNGKYVFQQKFAAGK